MHRAEFGESGVQFLCSLHYSPELPGVYQLRNSSNPIKFCFLWTLYYRRMIDEIFSHWCLNLTSTLLPRGWEDGTAGLQVPTF